MKSAVDNVLGAELARTLRSVTVRAWRLWLRAPGVGPTVSMVRGVWGKALRGISIDVYREIFDGTKGQPPRYVLRPTAGGVGPKPAIEFLLFGPPEEAAGNAVWAAWDEACRLGLGPKRLLFAISKASPLAWDETVLPPARRQPGFALASLATFEGREDAPCRLRFDAPLRILRDDSLITEPILADLTAAALRRIHAFAETDLTWPRRAEWIELAREIPAGRWCGDHLEFRRYSGSQKREVQHCGVAGYLDLPKGPGPLAPLLAAAQWLHLGKGTVMGLGQMRIEPPSVP